MLVSRQFNHYQVAALVFSLLLDVARATGQNRGAEPASAKQDRTGVTLRVVDAQGAPCVGAVAALIKNGESAGIAVRTDENGAAPVGLLTPGQYSLAITFANFEPLIKSLMIRPGDVRVIQATLSVAPTVDWVEVRNDPVAVVQPEFEPLIFPQISTPPPAQRRGGWLRRWLGWFPVHRK
jgi:carboxypeptidase family protein